MRVLLLSLAALARADPDSYLKPLASATGPEAALVWIQGALIPAHEYTPLLQKIQAASGLKLWIGQPSFTLDTPEPALLPHRIDTTLKMMRSAGMNTTTIFYGAHSLGTVFLQMYCATASNGCAGQILTGGPLARTNYYPSFSYAVPTLTMAGSMDGLSRVTRATEGYYHQVQLAKQQETFPVVVIEGMNHYQWASEAPSLLEKERDLKAELTLDESHKQAATLAAAFLALRVGATSRGGDGDTAVDAVAASTLAAGLRNTAEFVAPIIGAYESEGSRHFNGPRQIDGPGADACVKGGCPDQSSWATVAQGIVAGSLPDGWGFSATNEFVDCSSTPLTGGEFHLPTITNSSATKTVSSTTYSQCNWDLGDAEDTGFVYTSASEIGTKLSSRQCIYIKGLGKTDTPFSVDDPQFCKMANQAAYAWALSKASPATRARYYAHGQNYTFGDDISKAGGPLFLNAGITYKDNGDAGVEVSSPMQKTEQDYWKDHFGPIPRPSIIPDPGCFHYCKLLSPARAMEWIYVDGLRRHYSLGNSSSARAAALALVEKAR